MNTQQYVAPSSQCLYIYSLIYQAVHINTHEIKWQNYVQYSYSVHYEGSLWALYSDSEIKMRVTRYISLKYSSAASHVKVELTTNVSETSSVTKTLFLFYLTSNVAVVHVIAVKASYLTSPISYHCVCISSISVLSMFTHVGKSLRESYNDSSLHCVLKWKPWLKWKACSFSF